MAMPSISDDAQSTCSSIGRTKRSRLLNFQRAVSAKALRRRTSETSNSTACSCEDVVNITVKNRVRFNKKAKKHKIPSVRFMDDEEIDEVWYCPEEREEMRRSAKVTASKFLQRNSENASILIATYEKACSIAQNVTDTNEMDKVLKGVDQLPLGSWTSMERNKDSSCRGLEEWISPRFLSERRDAAHRSRASIVELSRKRGVTDEEVAQKYRELSFSSAILARAFADVDVLVAK